MKTVFSSVKKLRPSSAISRSPTPVDLVPPNGSCASPPTVGSLTCTMPVSTSSMNFMTDVMSDVKIDVVKPYSTRSEERRVGKEGSSRGVPDDQKNNG